MNSSSERLVPIQFGTSGHRGMFGTGFVPEHVSALCRALGDFFAELGVARPKIALGYDTRRGNDPAFGPGSLTALAAEMLAKAGIEVISFHEYTPTPFISWAIPAFKLDGGLILTASHNPPQYGGMKFNPGNGAPADSTITDRLAELANLWLCNGGASGDSEDSLAGSFEPAGLSSCACGPAGQPGPDLPFRQLGPAVPSLPLLTLESPTMESSEVVLKPQIFDSAFGLFLGGVLEGVDRMVSLDGVRRSLIAVAVDCRHGTTGAIWKLIFEALGMRGRVRFLCETPLADFGGIEPNPTKPGALDELIGTVKAHGLALGIANDPDGDRHVVVDETGSVLSPEEVCLIIYHDLVTRRRVMVAGIASTVASSSLLAAACAQNAHTYVETAVGFKYFQSFLEDCRQSGKIGLAVESSGGFTASFHTLDKCGFLPGVWLLAILADTGLPLSALRAEIHQVYGTRFFEERQFAFELSQKDRVSQFLRSVSPADAAAYFSSPVQTMDRRDGLKIQFKDGSWILIRLSGTEPVGRIYGETLTAQTLPDRMGLAQRWVSLA